MKIVKIEPVNQIESNLFVKHKVEDMKEGELIQRCVCCGEIIEDYTPKPGWVTIGGGDRPKTGSPAGYIYVNKSGSSQMRITEMAITMGFLSEPKEVVDCTAINS